MPHSDHCSSRLALGSSVRLDGGTTPNLIAIVAASRCPVEKWMREANLEESEEGTADIQRLIIARGVLH